jgi:hypothetical protein
VLNNLAEMIARCGFQDVAHEVLFSRRRFKQRGAHYGVLGGAPAQSSCRADLRLGVE